MIVINVLHMKKYVYICICNYLSYYRIPYITKFEKVATLNAPNITYSNTGKIFVAID